LTLDHEVLSLIGIDETWFGGTPEAVKKFMHTEDIEPRRKARAKAFAEGDLLE
jgi:hypothetical protein